MNVEESVLKKIKQAQIADQEGRPQKLVLLITGWNNDISEGAVFYSIDSITIDESGNEILHQTTTRYSALLSLNEQLIHKYGLMRIYRIFPPKKAVGNKDEKFVQTRQKELQQWLSEIAVDEEASTDKLVLDFFKIQTTEQHLQ